MSMNTVNLYALINSPTKIENLQENGHQENS